ncbi:MAG: hypothetical protein WBD20_13345, partial [Pirellulaceae bacterium]
ELAKAFYRNGNLNGQWKINTPLPTPSSPVVEANVELGKASGYMPVRSAFYLTYPGTDTRRLLSEVRTEWRKQAGMYLPVKMVGVDMTTGSGSPEYHCEVDIEWKIDKQLPSEFKIEHDTDDWREPVRSAFDKDWRSWTIDNE